MKWRCTNPSARDAPYYEGVTLDPRWLGAEGFANFLADMGIRPPGLTIDRIDAAGDYTPSNCRWADAHTQRVNRRAGSPC